MVATTREFDRSWVKSRIRDELDKFHNRTNTMSPSELAGQMDRDLSEGYRKTPEKKSKPSEKVTEPKVTTSRIRVLLSRPLSWAEVEDLTTDNTDYHLRRTNAIKDIPFKLWVAPNRQHVWVEGDLGSRWLFALVAAALEEHYVNVFPRAVRTFTEYNGE